MDTRGTVTDYEVKKGIMSRMKRYFRAYLPQDRSERIKLLLLTLSFFLIIGAYTITKELKDIVFSEIVGKEYIWLAKLISIVLLVPSILLYSKFVDTLRRYQLLGGYSFAYGAVGLLFALLLNHPSIGLPNTDAGPYRIFGWLFYFFIEGYSPFVVSVFWSFVNSINNPESAKKNYALMVTGSKVGGMTTAAFAWVLLNIKDVSFWSHTMRYQVLLGTASLLLLMVPIVLYLLIKKVAGSHLHGYEAVYQVGKKRAKAGESETGMFSGLSMLIKYPYAFGIFCVVLFYEIIQTILNFQRIGIAKEGAATVSEFGASLFAMIFFVHFVGFIISLVGTRVLLEKLGEKRCLLLVPISTALLFIFFRVMDTQFSFFVFLIGIRAIHYAFSYPVRESLYIPTVKEINFKSKSWTDAFGAKFAKATGSAFNGITVWLGLAAAQSILFTGIIGLWVLVAYMLGSRFEKAIENNEVIGLEKE